MGWLGRIILGFVVVVLFGVVGTGIYASGMKPPQHAYEQVIPSDRFPV